MVSRVHKPIQSRLCLLPATLAPEIQHANQEVPLREEARRGRVSWCAVTSFLFSSVSGPTGGICTCRLPSASQVHVVRVAEGCVMGGGVGGGSSVRRQCHQHLSRRRALALAPRGARLAPGPRGNAQRDARLSLRLISVNVSFTPSVLTSDLSRVGLFFTGSDGSAADPTETKPKLR